MKKLFAYTALIVASTCCPSFAQNSSCDLLKDYEELATSSFRNEPTQKPPGASECWVQDSAYWCEWEMDSKSQARQEFVQFFGDVKACFPSAEATRIRQTSTSGFVTTTKAEFYVTYSSHDVSLSVERVD
ncbi:hypothetical protein HFO21_20380 [Rhizobium laguerreae]|uniref:hypothetical protein n=1 Tax=Rhizobium laguerreae TaxID=1076926 RepID=UPI001C912EBA|nr:hypothetical protein [Rhizobium laguerreae]MBY3216686.1 hypothetical protein [Rhizobium laguerreae]